MIRRAGTSLFAMLAVTLSAVAVGDIYLHGRFALVDPALLAAVAVIGTIFLLFGLLALRESARQAQSRTERLTQLVQELEAANVRLNASEARYKGLVDTQGEAISRRTPDGRLTYANEGFCRLFAVRLEDIIGKHFPPISASPTAPAGPVPFAVAEPGQDRISYDQHLNTPEGYRWMAWEDYAIRDSNGALVEIQTVGHDVTERKMLEAALTEARDKAEGANRAKSHFLATMSHEIRTPMNGVLGMARLLMETPLAPDQKTYAEAIRQSGLSLLHLIEDILDFSKIESGALVLNREEVPLRPLIEEVAELLSTRAHAKGIEIATAIDADVPDFIRTDGIRLRQVLTNLVGNALKFTEMGGVLITIVVERAADGKIQLLLSVRDTGIGVPADKQAAIFEDFVQADSSHARRFEGTGLGLAISKRLTEAMSGKIGVVSNVDQGSLFWVRLPLEEQDLRAPSLPLKAKRVALICKSSMLREGLRRQLAVAGAVYVETAEPSPKLSGPICDVILMDVPNDAAAFPDVSAFAVPVVALLHPDQRPHLGALSAKAIRGYLMKPVRQDSLEKRLAALHVTETEPVSAAAQIPAERRGSTGLSILVAEDNIVNALLARELLRRRGHRVQEVRTGEAAAMACAAQRFDLVIMDLHMPGVGGIEATRRIRQAEAEAGAARVPIFALTADALETGREACLAAGMDGFMTKPVDPADLDAILGSIAPPAATMAA